jgi:hypothetical protein
VRSLCLRSVSYRSLPTTHVHLTCITNKVVIIDKPTGIRSSDTQESLNFCIDEASKRVSFADGVPLSIRRFDDAGSVLMGGGVSYEFDRESRSVSFAGTIMKEGTATIIIGAGRCTLESDAR